MKIAKFKIAALLAVFICPVVASAADIPADLQSAMADYNKGFYNQVTPGERASDYLIRAKDKFASIASARPGTNDARLSLLRIGFCQYKLGEFTAAIGKLTEYIEQNPQDSLFLVDDAKYQLGLAYSCSGAAAGAELWYRSVLAYRDNPEAKLKNVLPDAYFELWRLCMKEGAADKAALVYSEFLAAFPDHPKAEFMFRLHGEGKF